MSAGPVLTHFLSHLEGVRQTGAGSWTSRCPAHDDRSPSLSIKDTGDRILIHCFSGCTPTDVAAAVGLELRDLFHEPLGQEQRRERPVQASCAQRDERATPTTTAPSRTQSYAHELWDCGTRDDSTVAGHPYAKSRGIYWAAGAGRVRASGKIVGKDADCIVIPARVHGTGEVAGVQVINETGRKQSFGGTGGSYLLLGNTLDKNLPWFVVEGWCDAATMAFDHHHGNAVAAVAFGLSNLETIAERIADEHAPKRVVIVKDAA